MIQVLDKLTFQGLWDFLYVFNTRTVMTTRQRFWQSEAVLGKKPVLTKIEGIMGTRGRYSRLTYRFDLLSVDLTRPIPYTN